MSVFDGLVKSHTSFWYTQCLLLLFEFKIGKLTANGNAGKKRIRVNKNLEITIKLMPLLICEQRPSHE